MQVPQPLESLLPQKDLPVLNSIFLSPKTHHERFYSSFFLQLGLLLSSCGDKPGNQRVEKPETNTTLDNLQTETSPASNAPEMLPPPPEPLSLVSRDGLFYKGSDTTPFSGKYEETFDSGSPRMEIIWSTVSRKAWRKVGRKRANSC